MKSVGGVAATRGDVLPPLVFTSGRPKPLAFFVKGVHTFEEFYGLVAEPKPAQGVFTKEHGWVPDEKSPAYIDQLREYHRLKWAYTVIKSLEPSEIVWDLVNPADTKTWKHVHKEVRDTLSDTEFILLMNKIEEANTLDAEKLEENRETFFREREAAQRALAGASQNTEAASTPSGGPASE